MTRKTKKQQQKARASISFDPADYSSLQELADEKKVSVAWVVREAVDEYLGKAKKDDQKNE